MQISKNLHPFLGDGSYTITLLAQCVVALDRYTDDTF